MTPLSIQSPACLSLTGLTSAVILTLAPRGLYYGAGKPTCEFQIMGGGKR